MFDNLNELIGTNLGITDGRLERIERHGRRILGVGSRRVAHATGLLNSFAKETPNVARISTCIVTFVHQEIRILYEIAHTRDFPVGALTTHQLRIGQHQEVVALGQCTVHTEVLHLATCRQVIHQIAFKVGDLSLAVGIENKGTQEPAADVVQVAIHIREEQRSLGHIHGYPSLQQ